VLLAASVPLLLLVRWGHLNALVLVNGPAIVRTVVTAYDGSVLSPSVEIALIVLSCLVVGLGLLTAISRSIHPSLLALCAAAMAIELVLIVVRWNAQELFVNSSLDVDLRWTYGPAWTAAVILSAAGAAAWFGLFIVSLVNVPVCPDCAEPIPRRAMDCPHCGYKLPLRDGLKRCEACQQPVKAEANVCRHCGHRFGMPVAS
jgi:Double zinc ribbon